jgi:uncharacterized membrane protein YdcZ (DUF606 family)
MGTAGSYKTKKNTAAIIRNNLFTLILASQLIIGLIIDILNTLPSE